MDRKTRKIMILNRCLHPRRSVERLYTKRKEGGRGGIGVKYCITNERKGLCDYLQESKEDMLSGRLKENVIEEGETKEEFTKRKTAERKKTLHTGKLQDNLLRKPETWHTNFQESGEKMKKETALRTMEAEIDKKTVSPKYRFCGTNEETVIHLVSDCHKLVQKQ